MTWITGKNGALARALRIELNNRDIAHIASDKEHCNLQNFDAVYTFYQEHQPTHILHCAAFTNVDLASVKQSDALAANFLAVQYLIRVADPNYTKIIFFSSDYLFDGQSTGAYTEETIPKPLQFYGKTKLLAEQALQKNYKNHLIIRLSWLYSYKKGFPLTIIQLAHQETLQVLTDEIGSPTFIPLILNPILSLTFSDIKGIYHLASEGSVSRYDLAQETLKLAKQANIITQIPIIQPITAKEYQDQHPHIVNRPTFSALNSDKVKEALQLSSLATWQEHLKTFIENYPSSL